MSTMQVDNTYRKSALEHLTLRLEDTQFVEYQPQIAYMIIAQKRDVLVDSFYQTLPFGTWGRRGLVGIGPNRINLRTVGMSAQGHSRYLLMKYGEEAKTRGIVVGYDCREYRGTTVYDASIPNPVYGLSGKAIAQHAAKYYAAHGIVVHFFPTMCPTPEVSYMVRSVWAVAGEMISASHNPPEYNGEKIQDAYGWQVVPPEDEVLIKMVEETEHRNVSVSFEDFVKQGKIQWITDAQRAEYRQFLAWFSLSSNRSARIYFSPFHGTAIYSVVPVLRTMWFDLVCDEASMLPDPLFSSLAVRSPNPELREAYETLKAPALAVWADCILVTDPDADRIGCMSWERTERRFFTGNEIAILVLSYVLQQYQKKWIHKPTHTVVTTLVTTHMIRRLCEYYNVCVIDTCLVGIKYIAEEIRRLEECGRGDDFLLGVEESHGLTMWGLREKESTIPAILLSELAWMCKENGSTLGSYLDQVYHSLGYVYNTQREIKLPGAEGMVMMQRLMAHRRTNWCVVADWYQWVSVMDMRKESHVVSQTDKVAKNVVMWHCVSVENPLLIEEIILTVRPSGTEPKVKIYIEVCMHPVHDRSLGEQKTFAKTAAQQVGDSMIDHAHKVIGIDRN